MGHSKCKLNAFVLPLAVWRVDSTGLPKVRIKNRGLEFELIFVEPFGRDFNNDKTS